MNPTVSVVIPTRGRAAIALRAVHSALAQTFADLETIVVVDGEDPSTIEALGTVNDSRLRVISLSQSVGGSEARNTGARAAKGNWIAFLDDDDEWLPGKVEAQLDAALKLSGPYIFVASRYVERSESGDRVLPTRRLNNYIPFSDFLFCRDSFRSGTGYVQTSTWFVSRQLMDEVPFTKGLPRNQDVDWMVHAAAKQGFQVKILEEPLAIFHHLNDPGRVSKRADWRFQYDWALANRSYLSFRALSFCIATLCVPDAVRQKEPAAVFFRLLTACLTKGRPSLLCLGFFFYNWLISDELRNRVRSGGFRKLKVLNSI